MIVPDITSPLRPIIAAFYRAAYMVGLDWGVEETVRSLRQVLADSGLQVEAAPIAELDLIVDEMIGVAVVPSVADLTDDVRRRVRKAMAGDGAPGVALLMAFVPRPRLARVDVLRRAKSQPSLVESDGPGEGSGEGI